MANRFYINPPNPLEALMMGVQGYEGASKRAKEADITAARQSIAQGGNPRDVLLRLIGAGDIQGANVYSGIQDRAESRAFRESEAQRTQRNADRSYGLQQQQFQATQSTPTYQTVTDESGVSRLVQIPRQGGAPSYITPSGGQPASPATPIPPGADPKTFRVETAKSAVKSSQEASDLQLGGRQVLGMVDNLEAKTWAIDPKTKQRVDNPLFKEAVGPFVGEVSGQSNMTLGGYLPNPAKLGYEMYQSRQAKAYLDQIKQDAQGINTVMQRALLKGGGQITENERAQINEILGKIATARSPEDARALLNNFRGIVRKIFQMPDGQTVQGGVPQPSAGGGIPPPPQGFVVSQ